MNSEWAAVMMEAREWTRMREVSKTPCSYDTFDVSDLVNILSEDNPRQSILAHVLACASATKVQWRVEETCQSPPGSSDKP